MMAAYLAAHVDEGPLRWANLPPAWLRHVGMLLLLALDWWVLARRPA